jgi:hypothetical protein
MDALARAPQSARALGCRYCRSKTDSVKVIARLPWRYQNGYRQEKIAQRPALGSKASLNAYHGKLKDAVLNSAGLYRTLITFTAEAVLTISHAFEI